MTTYLFLGNKGTGKSTAVNSLFSLSHPASGSPSHVTVSHTESKVGSDYIIDTVGFDLEASKLFRDLFKTEQLCVILLLNDIRFQTTRDQVAALLKCNQDKINCYWAFYFTYSNEQINKSTIKPISRLIEDFRNNSLIKIRVERAMPKVNLVRETYANLPRSIKPGVSSQESNRASKFKEINFYKLPKMGVSLKEKDSLAGLKEAVHWMSKQKVTENRRKGDHFIKFFLLHQELNNDIYEFMMTNGFMRKFLEHICQMAQVDLRSIEALMKSSTTNSITSTLASSSHVGNVNYTNTLSDESFADFFEALYYCMFFELKSPCFYCINDKMIAYAKQNLQILN